MEGVTAEVLSIMIGKMDKICNAITDLKAELGATRTELKGEIKSVRTELKEEIASVKTELQDEIASVRIELKKEIASVRTELKDEITSVRTELKAEIASVRYELKQDMVDLESNLKNEIRVQIEKSNSEMSDYMLNDIIPILNNLDARTRFLEENYANNKNNIAGNCDVEYNAN